MSDDRGLPDDLTQVTAEVVTRLWEHGMTAQNGRLAVMRKNDAYLRANRHPSGMRLAGRPDKPIWISSERAATTGTRELWMYVNMMRNNLTLLVDALSSRKPVFLPVETHADDYAVAAGNLADSLLQAKYADQWAGVFRNQVLWHTYVGGCVGVWTDWDAASQTTTEVLTTLNNMTFEPGSKMAERARWGIKQQILPAGVLRNMYPQQFPRGEPQGTARDVWSLNALSSADIFGDTVVVRTLYVRPSPVHPQGGFFVSADDRVLQAGPYPYMWQDRLPVCVLRQQPFDEVWWGGTMLENCTTLQAYINQVWSYILMGLRDYSAPILEATRDMETQLESLGGRPGQRVFRQAGSPTTTGMQYIAPPSWQPGMLQALSITKAELDDMMGMQDVLRGRNAPNIESGVGVQALQQAAMGDINAMSRREAVFWGRVATNVIDIHKQHLLTPRRWLLTPAGERSSRDWSGRDLMPVSAVEVPEASLDPTERRMIQAISQQAFVAGHLDPAMFVKMTQLDTYEQFLATLDPHSYRATRENVQIKSLDDEMRAAAESEDPDAMNAVVDKVRAPKESDDHERHIKVHGEFKSSEEYDRMHWLTRQAFDAHLMTHQREIQQQLMNNAALNQMMMAPQQPQLEAAA